MVDNVTPPFTGTGQAGPLIATDDLGGGIQVQRVKVGWGVDGSFADVDIAASAPLPIQPRDPSGNDLSAGGVTATATIIRPATTTTYTVNDILSDSTTAPTTGGFTFTGLARGSGGKGIITDVVVLSDADPALTLQGELWVFDQAVTNVIDNAVFALSDADSKNLVAVIPFALTTTQNGSGANSYCHVQNLSIAFTCVGSANLRFLVKVKNAYIPVSGEVITVRAKSAFLN